jgi:hypothetical protein
MITPSCLLQRAVRLSVPEVQYAMAIATQRDACKGEMRDSRLKKSISGFGVHFVGVVGELCFRKVYGGKINTAILPNGDGHSRDVILADGREVEVKTSLYQGSGVELKFEQNEIGKVQYCSLVQVSLPDTGTVFPIWSWQEIEPNLVTKDYGYGPRYVFQPQLNQ